LKHSNEDIEITEAQIIPINLLDFWKDIKICLTDSLSCKALACCKPPSVSQVANLAKPKYQTQMSVLIARSNLGLC
jgi:hypothetical protein